MKPDAAQDVTDQQDLAGPDGRSAERRRQPERRRRGRLADAGAGRRDKCGHLR